MEERRMRTERRMQTKIKLMFDNNARQDLLKKYTTHRIMLEKQVNRIS